MIRRLGKYLGAKADGKATGLSISVVTPSYNQAEFLGECLGSVASQTKKPIEHLVYDPGSTDQSRHIAQGAPGVTLVAEPDEGQADAVGKGLSRARGDVIAWINSDDCYADDHVFQRVIDRFAQEDKPDIVYGRGIYIGANGEKTRDAYINKRPKALLDRLPHEVGILQPALFLRRSVIEKIGLPDRALHFAMDYDYWIRAAKAGLKFAFLDHVLAKARYYEENKTLGKRGESYAEIAQVVCGHFGFLDARWARRWAEFLVHGYDGVLRSGAGHDTNEERVQAETARILRAHNQTYEGTRALAEPESPAAEYTRDVMASLGLPVESHCKPVPEDQVTGSGWTCYTVERQRWAFRTEWLNDQLARTAFEMNRLRSSRRGDTCVIVGNGPSLNQTDLGQLEGTDVFCSNYAYLNAELFRHATYLSVVNNLVAEQGAASFSMLRGVTKFFPYWLAYCIVPDELTFYFKSVGRPEFSTDINENVSWRHTVSFFQLQLAYGLGYRRVALVGFDHSYAQKAGVQEGAVIEQVSADQNHFDPKYFKGKKWHAADVDNMEAMYRLAKQAYEADGREIVNSTVGGHLELFRRVELREYIGSGVPHREPVR